MSRHQNAHSRSGTADHADWPNPRRSADITQKFKLSAGRKGRLLDAMTSVSGDQLAAGRVAISQKRQMRGLGRDRPGTRHHGADARQGRSASVSRVCPCLWQ
jgi:hypothetical protein